MQVQSGVAHERERRLKLSELRSADETHNSLDPYVDYIAWTKGHFPTGHSSIMTITEEAVRKFRKDNRYKNDVRYVQLWMDVGKKQKDPSDLVDGRTNAQFKYLISNGIGQETTLFYEEYAGYKESMGCWDEADEIYKLGISRRVDQLSRLVRLYDSFLLRRSELEPGSVDHSPGLALKEKPVPTARQDDVQMPASSSRAVSSAGAKERQGRETKAKQNTASKLVVFQDDPAADMASKTTALFPPANPAWTEYDTGKTLKENADVAPEKWSDARLPSASANPAAPKLKVFRDEENQEIPEQRKTKKPKTVLQPVVGAAKADILDESFQQIPEVQAGSVMKADTSLCYVDKTEYSFEETRASLCYKAQLEDNYPVHDDLTSHSIMTPRAHSVSAAAVASPWRAPMSSNLDGPSSPGEKAAIQDIFKMFEDVASEGSATKESKKPEPKPASPTIHTKDALKAISDMFSHPLESSNVVLDADESAILYNPEDDETISRQVYRRPLEPLKLGVFRDEDSDEGPQTDAVQATPASKEIATVFGHPVHVMTPVTEMSDRTHTTHSYANASLSISGLPVLEEEQLQTISRFDSLPDKPGNLASHDNDGGSGQTDPALYVTCANPCDPSDPALRRSILVRAKPQPSAELTMLPQTVSTLSSVLAEAANGTEFKLAHQLLRLEAKLSDEYYLVTDKSRALLFRVRVPPSIWEYYILKVLRSRLADPLLQHAVVSPVGFTMFQNESWLSIDGNTRCTLQDVIGATIYGPTGGIPEVVAAFWTSQLLQMARGIHAAGVVHGDICPHNLLIRPNEMQRGLGRGFGLVLNDWSAAIDLRSFPPGQTFALPPSDEEQDECWEFTNGKEWVYEPDWYGVASVIHLAIFGSPIKLVQNHAAGAGRSGKPFLEIQDSIPPHWHGGLWIRVFEVLLNLSSASCDTDPLRAIAAEFADFLVMHDHLLHDALSKVLAKTL
ncbi:hypothetical protein HDV03_001313 [Kappamyces sp. JEL0829]|nr:hypothetical protein HDV03_001313 [Kappamyces sp. JEL0829]